VSVAGKMDGKINGWTDFEHENISYYLFVYSGGGQCL